MPRIPAWSSSVAGMAEVVIDVSGTRDGGDDEGPTPK